MKKAKSNEIRKIAVENFLMSLSGNQMADNLNLDMDAQSYGWNSATVNAIREGIRQHYAKK